MSKTQYLKFESPEVSWSDALKGTGRHAHLSYALATNIMPDDRHTHDDIEISVTRPGIRGILSVNPNTQCFNLSRSGVQFGCNKDFKPGERLILDLHAFNIEASELSGVVTDREQLDDGMWCCEVRFCFEDKHMQDPHVINALLQIEDRLRTDDEFP